MVSLVVCTHSLLNIKTFYIYREVYHNMTSLYVQSVYVGDKEDEETVDPEPLIREIPR